MKTTQVCTYLKKADTLTKHEVNTLFVPMWRELSKYDTMQYVGIYTKAYQNEYVVLTI